MYSILKVGDNATNSKHGIIHETEIKQFGNRNGRNRVEIISTLGHKSRIVETDYEGRNELRGSKRITRIETNYEGRNEL